MTAAAVASWRRHGVSELTRSNPHKTVSHNLAFPSAAHGFGSAPEIDAKVRSSSRVGGDA